MKKKPVKEKPHVPWSSPWLWIVMILAALLYANTLNNGYVLDDYGVLRDNYIVKKGVDGIPMILKTPYRYGVGMLSDQIYRPLSLVMFAIEWQIAPDKPGLSHAVNVLFYALSCGLLYLVLRRLFSRYHPLLPLFACLLWVVHPVHTEVVANIKSRDEIMSAFFLFLSILGFMEYLDGKKRLYLLGSIISYFLAFLSKEGVVTFLVLFPVIGWFFSTAEKKRIWGASVLMLVPAGLYFLIRYSVLKAHPAAATAIPVVDNLLAAAIDPASRTATAVLILGKYLLKLLFPVTLAVDYSYNQIPVVNWTDPLALLSLLVYAGGLGFVVWKFRTRNPLVFGVLLYLVTMSIYSNLFVLIGSSFAERFLFLPSVGFSIVISWILLKLFRTDVSLTHRPPPVNLIRGAVAPWSLVVLLLLLYGGRTVARNAEWESQKILFSADVKRSPKSAHMHLYYGLALRDEAKEQEDQANYQKLMGQALQEFETAVHIYPDYADAYGQIGLAWFRLGQPDEALKNYEHAVRLDSTEGVFYANQGIIYFNRGDIRKAQELYQKSVELDPTYGDGYLNLGSTYGTLHQYELAIENFKKALEYLPDNARVYYYIGISYQSLNRPGEARPYLETAYRLDPSLRK
jgi:Tfp pilus assembly protein PilF